MLVVRFVCFDGHGVSCGEEYYNWPFGRGGAAVGHVVLGRASCFNTNYQDMVTIRTTEHNFGGTFFIASGSLVGFNMTTRVVGMFSSGGVPCRLCDSMGTGPAVTGMRGNITTCGTSNTSFVITLNNNSSVSATGNVNVMIGGPSFTSIGSLRKITSAGRGTIPAFTLPAATKATTRIAVGCIVVSRSTHGGVIYMSPGSVPTITVISPRLVCSVPGKLATTANVSTLARTVRDCVAPKT